MRFLLAVMAFGMVAVAALSSTQAMPVATKVIPMQACDHHLDKLCSAPSDVRVSQVSAAMFLPDWWGMPGSGVALSPTQAQDAELADPGLNLTFIANATVTSPFGTAHVYAGVSVVVGSVGPEPTTANSNETEPLVVCSDPAGCPDLVVEPVFLLQGIARTKETFVASDCNVDEGTVVAGQRRLLRFTTTTTNYGNGRLHLGDPASSPDWFTWGTCHGHWHLIDYADYRLWTLDGYMQWRDARQANPSATADAVMGANPGLAPEMVNGHKQGFCVIDLRQMVPFSPSNYWLCNGQGISPGWADEYNRLLDGQWIDVTDLSSGLYVLEVEVNAEHMVEESDYSNNAAAVLVALPPAGLW